LFVTDVPPLNLFLPPYPMIGLQDGDHP
jgi:hypothetical protein